MVKNVSIEKPNTKIVRDTFLRKDDMYGLEFYDQNNEVIYRLGLGDPFIVRMQHIDMEEREHFSFEAPISDFSIVIPKNINPHSVSLIRRDNQNIYSEVSKYILN